jgi:ABC-type transport system substrate-binding protein
MVNSWRWNTKAVFLPLLLLTLLLVVACGAAATATPVPEPTSAPAPQAAPAATTASDQPEPTRRLFIATPVANIPTPTPAGQVETGEVVTDRLIIIMDSPTRQGTLDCSLTGSATVQNRASTEYMTNLDRFNGEIIPMLATEWKMSEDARTWDFKLRQGVPWHFGYGEFTARDVENTLHYNINESCKTSYADYFRNNPDVDPQVISDYEIRFHMKHRPETIFDTYAWRGLPITSKAQWDTGCPNGAADYQAGPGGEIGYCAAGEPTVEAKPARTGPYQFVSYEKGVGYVYERVPYDHYRVNPDFQELELRFVKEPATRLAIMLAREGHIAEINRSLLQEALDDGLEVMDSQVPGVGAWMSFGGLYYDSTLADKYDPDIPWAAPGETGKKVRMAMNKAIDREQINRAIFAGLGERLWVNALYPSFPGGYNSEWEESWDELYGYDPEKAKELLAEAGYPNGFELPIVWYTSTGLPETPDFMEAIAGMWQEIGIEPDLQAWEPSRWREYYRGAKTNCCVYSHRSYAAPPATRIHFFFSPERFHRAYVSDAITEKRNRALNSLDVNEANGLWLEILNEVFYNHGGVPLFSLPVQAVIDPEVVAEYVFLGPLGGQYISLEYVKGVRE